MSSLTELEKNVEDSTNNYSYFIIRISGPLENYSNSKEQIGFFYNEIKLLNIYSHYFFQALMNGLRIFTTKEYKKYRNQLTRQIDEGVMRYNFNLKILNE
tara:strand:+ start:430 stop:729 length:300 start_codon:yes stop_codon:yes gene_type:complete